MVEFCASFSETAAWLGVSVTCRGQDNGPNTDMNSTEHSEHSSIESFTKHLVRIALSCSRA